MLIKSFSGLLVFVFILGAIEASEGGIDVGLSSSCVKFSKVDHTIVEERTSYYMIRFRAKVKNTCEENISGTAEFVIADKNSSPIETIPGEVLSRLEPNATHQIDQTFPIFKKNYKKGYLVFLEFYKKAGRK